MTGTDLVMSLHLRARLSDNDLDAMLLLLGHVGSKSSKTRAGNRCDYVIALPSTIVSG